MTKFLHLLLLLISFIAVNALCAQVKNLGNPISWQNKMRTAEIPIFALPIVDLSRHFFEDSLNSINKAGPWRFGYTHNTDLNLNNSGIWETLPNGARTWRLKIHSPNALSLNVIFKDFELGQGAFLHLYNEERTALQGAYTEDNNNKEKTLGTYPISGESIIIELYEPIGSYSTLSITNIIHGYRNTSDYINNVLKDLNDSDNCNYDVNCPLSAGWQNQINAVVLTLVNGAGYCSATLINNTAQDGRPYVLTADHCIPSSNDLSNWVFRFNWDSPTPVCAQNANSTSLPLENYPIINGATLRAKNARTDFALIELNHRPTTNNIYYAGWSRDENIPNGQVVGIHHPSGDVKKFSVEMDPVTIDEMAGEFNYWQVNNWDFGTTQPGSSGSALFDNNKRVIGNLYGGWAACNGLTNNGGDDIYGIFGISWRLGETPSERLKEWLDPLNTNAMYIDGYNPNIPTVPYDIMLYSIDSINTFYCDLDSIAPSITIKNHGTESINSLLISYGIENQRTYTYTWTGNLNSLDTAIITLPKIMVYNGLNRLLVDLSIPNEIDATIHNNNMNFDFEINNGQEYISVNIKPDCYGNETFWNIKNSDNIIIASGGNYPSFTNQLFIHDNICLSIGCYTFNIFDTYGDGIIAGGPCNYSGDFFLLNSLGDTIVRMQDAAFGATASYSFCINPSNIPIANFSSNKTNICKGDFVNFYSSSNYAMNYEWEFEGGTPATSTNIHPRIVYNTPGTYSVKLKAINSLGFDEIIEHNFITVGDNNMLLNINNNQNTLYTSIANGQAPYTYIWNTTETNANIEALVSGNYSVTITDANNCSISASINHNLVSTDKFNFVEFEANLYPNPTNDKATLELKNIIAEDLVISVYNINGQRLMSENIVVNIGDNLQREFDLRTLTSGVYIIHIASNNGLQSLKLIKN